MRDKADKFDCIANKLYSFYEKLSDTDKEASIKKMTTETMKLIRILAAKEETPTEYRLY